MRQEYSFTLTVPLATIEEAEALLQMMRQEYPMARISRKTDRKECARYYMSFPFSSARPDLKFQQWFEEKKLAPWDLFGPTYGRWGLS